MNRRTKRIMTSVTAMMLAFVVMIATGVSAFAADVYDIWYAGWLDDTYQSYLGWWSGDSEMAVDVDNYYKDSRYSLKLSNNNYNMCYAEKTFALEPYTTYKFSAMVKYSGYQLSPTAEADASGANIGQAFSWNHSEYTTSGNWTKLEYMFKTDATGKYSLCIQNGIYDGHCKGTAWFSDLKLEKATNTTKYNTLVVIFKNVDATIDITGKTTELNKTKNGIVRYQDSYTASDISGIKKTAAEMRKSMNGYAEGKMTFNTVDVVTIDTVITENELAFYDYPGDQWGVNPIHGYMVAENSAVVSGILDKYLAKKNYQQIAVYAPLNQISGGWGGVGGGKYNDIRFCQTIYEEWWGSDYHVEALCHEILHCIETDSEWINAELTPSLHSNSDYNYPKCDAAWFDAYIDATLPNGQGIQPLAYSVPSGKFTTVSTDMTSGGVIQQTDAFPLKLSKVTLYKVKDQVYTGKAIKPDVKLKDGTYTLKKNVDYTLSYKNNTNVGTATITIKGKGIYTGTRTLTFNITAQELTTDAPVVTLKKSGGNLKLSWNSVPGAEKYVIWYSVNGKNYKKWKEYDSTKTSVAIKYNSKNTYQFAVTAYIPELGKWTEYAYTQKM